MALDTKTVYYANMTCDRCGKMQRAESISEAHARQDAKMGYVAIHLREHNIPQTTQYDGSLCPTCYDSFEAWWEDRDGEAPILPDTDVGAS